MAGGHYTAFAKNFVVDKWCSFNGRHMHTLFLAIY
jgi:hypothetical protein